jgi:phosphinothricin acetyltransferase
MKDTILIREMVSNDWEQVKEIYHQGLDCNIATFQTTCPNYEEWDLGHLEDCRFVAVIGNKIVGWIALSATSKRAVYKGVVEVSIYVDSHASKQGVGTKLMEHLIKDSESKGYWSLYSSVIEENMASIALHTKSGFRKIGYREKIAKDRFGNWHNTILFEKRSSLI